jgi:putative tryptophan/tyrosine transport system substrate-binding protein
VSEFSRRQLLLALGAIALPLPGAAQATKPPKIGVLASADAEPTLGLLRERLRERGLIEGKQFVLEIRSAQRDPELLARMAAELVALKVDVIVAYLTPSVHAAKRATATIPIVMTGAGDPVATGLVASLARPGGNITGVSGTTAQLVVKNLEILREIRPGLKGVGILANPADPFSKPFLEQLGVGARALKLESRVVMATGAQDYDAAFAEWSRARINAVIFQPSLPALAAIGLALKHRMMLATPSLVLVENGALIGYAASPGDTVRKASGHIERILKGAKPAELPVEQPTQFELAINLKTAKAIGISLPRSLLLRADKVIE